MVESRKSGNQIPPTDFRGGPIQPSEPSFFVRPLYSQEGIETAIGEEQLRLTRRSQIYTIGANILLGLHQKSLLKKGIPMQKVLDDFRDWMLIDDHAIVSTSETDEQVQIIRNLADFYLNHDDIHLPNADKVQVLTSVNIKNPSFFDRFWGDRDVGLFYIVEGSSNSSDPYDTSYEYDQSYILPREDVDFGKSHVVLARNIEREKGTVKANVFIVADHITGESLTIRSDTFGLIAPGKIEDISIRSHRSYFDGGTASKIDLIGDSLLISKGVLAYFKNRNVGYLDDHSFVGNNGLHAAAEFIIDPRSLFGEEGPNPQLVKEALKAVKMRPDGKELNLFLHFDSDEGRMYPEIFPRSISFNIDKKRIYTTLSSHDGHFLPQRSSTIGEIALFLGLSRRLKLSEEMERGIESAAKTQLIALAQGELNERDRVIAEQVLKTFKE